MKLIRKLGTRLSKTGIPESWGEFYCRACKKLIERTLGNGKRQNYCGCTNGQTKTKLYTCWESMKSRCLNQNNVSYKNYGGRGITICPEWANDYTKFRDWALSNGYQEGLEIDREDNNGNYESNNCQWITNLENKRKQRRTKLTILLTNEIRDLYISKKYTRKNLSEKYKVSIFTIDGVIYNKIWRNDV